MKFIGAVFLLLALVTTGCVTSEQPGESFGLMNHPYLEQELTLTLTQDEQSSDLLLTLKNVSSHPVTNYFAQTRFEGSLWVLQEGAVPLKTYPTNYFDLVIHALFVNPEVVIPQDSSLDYRIPLASLVCPFSTRQPDENHPVLIYAFMDKAEAVSNVILLKHPERIPWGPPKSRRLSDIMSGF
jgi:hypothetical protein